MAEFLSQMQFWHWWILGLALAIIEVLAPGFFFLWLGIAAGLTGVIALIAPGLGWQFQILIFSVMAVASVVGTKYYLKRQPIETDDPTLNRRGDQYVGRVFNLEEAIVNGRGKVHVGDTVWRASGPDMPAGQAVRVVGVEGTVLVVQKA